MRIKPSIFASLALIGAVLCGCNAGKKAGNAAAPSPSADAVAALPPPAPVASGPTLLGSWKNPACRVVPGVGTSQDAVAFQGTTVIYFTNAFSDDKCQKQTSTTTKTGTFQIGEASATVANATDLDLLYHQQTVTYLSNAAAVTAAHGYASGTAPLCAGGAAPLVNGEVVDLTPCIKDVATLIQHVTFTLSGQTLVLGGDATFTKQ